MRTLARLAALTLLGALTTGLAQAATLTAKDYVEIRQLYARYSRMFDSRDIAGWLSTFTPDGEFNNTFKGREGLEKFAQQWAGGNRHHFLTDLQLFPTPEGATGIASLLLVDFSTKPATIASTAVYNDTLVKTRDGWRFRTRVVTNDAAAPAPAVK